MSNPNKQKGTKWESDVRDLLNEADVFPGEVLRAPPWGANDQGDLTGTGAFCFEAKAVKSINLAGFMDEATVEAANAGKPFPVALVKRRQKPAAQGYAVMEIRTLIDIIRKLNETP